MLRDHLGNEALKSGKDVTPGHAVSSGVPNNLYFLASCTPFSARGSKPEYLEDLVNLGIARE